ncbi:hypothetical protein GC194_07705 [bacterium]|nr:hypothetical protein [bacterium]
MENSSYNDFNKLFNKIISNDLSDEKFEVIKSFVEDGTFELTSVLKGAIDNNDFNQINTIIESIRREYFLEKGGVSLFKILLTTAINFVKRQNERIEEDLMWNVKQIMDIELHQSHLVENNDENNNLFFELCYELADPRFKEIESTDENELYGLCIYFLMFSSGHFKDNPFQLRKLQPRIQRIIENDYGRDHYFSESWLELFENE